MHDTEYTVQTPDEGAWVVVEVTVMFNPAHFCLIFPYGTNTVQDLMKDGTGETSVDGEYRDVTTKPV